MKRLLNFFKKHYKIFIILVIIVAIVFSSIKYYQKAQEEKRNKAIINYCEQYKWNDSLRNQENWDSDGRKLIGQSDFLCSEHLYLKPRVKKSNTGICHEEGSTYYYRTKNYKIFDSIDKCLQSGGRMPNN